MLKTLIFLSSILLISINCASYQTMQKQFKQLQIISVSQLLPQIALTKTSQAQSSLSSPRFTLKQYLSITLNDLQAQVITYTENYENYIKGLGDRSQYIWKGDPQISSNFQLRSRGESQSFYLKGQQTSQLVLDLAVIDVNTLSTAHEGVFLLIINLSSLNEDYGKLSSQQKNNHQKVLSTILENIYYKVHTKKHHFDVITFTSNLYEVLVIQYGQSQEASSAVKNINLQMSIEVQSRGETQKDSFTLQQQNQMVSNMKKILNQNTLTFLDSLELWQKIKQQKQQHQESFQFNESMQIYQIIGIIALYIVEYAALRYITKRKQVV